MQKFLQFSALALLALPLFLTSCDSLRGRGDLVQEDRTVENFHQLNVSTPGKVIAKVGAYSLHIQCEENILPYLRTEVNDGELSIWFSRPVYDVDDLVITVTAPNYDGFDISGSVDLDCADAISGQTLDLRVSGSGDIALSNVDFDQVDASVSGSGKIVVHGQADVLHGAVSGSGNLFAEDCPVKNAEAEVSGSGELRCNVADLLKARISGSGDVRYRGQPQIDAQVSGSGDIRPL